MATCRCSHKSLADNPAKRANKSATRLSGRFSVASNLWDAAHQGSYSPKIEGLGIGLRGAARLNDRDHIVDDLPCVTSQFLGTHACDLIRLNGLMGDDTDFSRAQ